MGILYLRFRHKCDIYTRTSTTNAAGQHKHTWTLSQSDVPCDFEDEISKIRTGPTVETIRDMKMIFSRDTVINDSMRIKNIRDRMGNLIDAGPMQIDGVQKLMGFQGKIHHNVCGLKSVIEE